MSPDSDGPNTPPSGIFGGKYIRGALNAVGGAIPFAGGILSAISGAWSESEQERVNSFFRHWLKMMEAEMEEKQQTVIEIMQRLDMHEQKIADRVLSQEYQSLMRKGFRDWAGSESEDKRILIRNVLSNAASSSIVSDDVIRLFMEWIRVYSELHFSVIGRIYNNSGITRGDVWIALGKAPVREDSAEADLFRLLFRDLSTGGLIRQHRETDSAGNFIKRQQRRADHARGVSRGMKSAFDEQDEYELTQLGQQFVHYAMTELPLKLVFHPEETPSAQHESAEAEKMATSAS